MKNMAYDKIMKIGIVGDSSVGKTSILSQYSKSIFARTQDPTVGVDFVSKTQTITVDNAIKRIKLNIWDTAGQEKYRSISLSYL